VQATRLTGSKRLLDFLIRRCDAERVYGLALEQLASVDIEQFAESGLEVKIKSLKEDCMKRAKAIEHFLEKIEVKVLEELKKMINEQKLRQKLAYATWYSVEATYYDRLQNLKSEEEKNVEAYKAFDLAISSYESICEKMSLEKKRKHDQKICQLFLSCKNADKNYTKAVHMGRNGRVDYIKGLQHVLDMYEKLEEERFNALNKTINTYYSETLDLNEELNKIIGEGINNPDGSLEDEFHSIIKKYSSEEKSIKDIDVARKHSKYPDLYKKFEVHFMKNSNLVNLTLDAVKSTIVTPSEELKDENLSVFRQVLKDCWTLGGATEEKLNEYKQLIKTNKGREDFCDALNYFRAKGMFSIPQKCFNSVANLLTLILDEINKVNDSANAMKVLILSQTYYVEVIIKNKVNKVFLQHQIQRHELWSRREIWENEMNFEKDEELVLSSTIAETEEEKKIRLQNIIFGKLGTFAHNMIQFGNKREMIEDIILKNAQKANLSPTLIDDLKVIIHIIIGNYCIIHQG